MKGRRHAQTPPFSAKKIAGIPAHRLARKGQPVELKPKQVEIKELEFYDCGGLEQLERAPSTNTLDELFLHPRLVLPEFPAVAASPESAARSDTAAPSTCQNSARPPSSGCLQGKGNCWLSPVGSPGRCSSLK
jgi:hypothetical protein